MFLGKHFTLPMTFNCLVRPWWIARNSAKGLGLPAGEKRESWRWNSAPGQNTFYTQKMIQKQDAAQQMRLLRKVPDYLLH